MYNVSEKKFAHYLDLADHSPTTTEHNVKKLCHAVLEYNFNSAFINPCYIHLAKKLFKENDHPAKTVGTVISFPLGQETMSMKLTSIREAIKLGVDELDTSLNVAFIKEARWEKCLEEMLEIVETAREEHPNIIVKFIPETGYLTQFEIQRTAELMVQAGTDFFKTCSGMGPRGATIEDVRLVRQAVGDQIKIKVAGGIATYQQAHAFIQAGADRIGTSKAVEIITEFLQQ